MSTYGMLRTSAEHFGSDDNGRDFIWDYVILDEGHKIKNPSNKTTKAAHATPARHRLIMTGTWRSFQISRRSIFCYFRLPFVQALLFRTT